MIANSCTDNLSIIELIEKAMTFRVRTNLPRTKADNPSALVEPYPDNPSSLEIPVPSARLLFGYTGSTFETLVEEPLHQSEKLIFEGTLQVFNLRTHQGGYALMRSVSESLRGFYPLRGQMKPLRPDSFALKGEAENSWLWSLKFHCLIFSGQQYQISSQVPADFTSDEVPDNPDAIPTAFTVESGIWRVVDPGDRIDMDDRSVLDSKITILEQE